MRALEGIERQLIISEALHDHLVQAIHKQQEAAKSNSEPEPRILVHSTLELPLEAREYYRSEHGKTPRKKIWAPIRNTSEIGAVLVALGIAILTYRTLQQVKRQADAGQGQVNIMQRQLEATDRPWIEIINTTSKNGFVFYKRVDNGLIGIDSSFLIQVKNIGRSVASHVKAVSRVVFESPGDDDKALTAKERSMCQQQSPFFSSTEFTLFPDQDSGNKLAEGPSSGYATLVPQDAVFETASNSMFIDPAIMGCITYEAPTGNRHHTGFIYEFRIKNGGVVFARQLFKLGVNFPAEKIALVEPAVGFSDAD